MSASKKPRRRGKVLVTVPVYIEEEFCSRRCAYFWEEIPPRINATTTNGFPSKYACYLQGAEEEPLYLHPGTDKPLRTATCRRLTAKGPS